MNQIKAGGVLGASLLPIHRRPSAIRTLEQIPRSKVAMTEAGAKLDLGCPLGIGASPPRPVPGFFPGRKVRKRTRGFGQKPIVKKAETILPMGISRAGCKPFSPQSTPLAAGFPAQAPGGVPPVPGGHAQEILLPSQNILSIWIGDEFSHHPNTAFLQKKNGAGNGVMRISQQHPGTWARDSAGSRPGPFF